MCGGLSHWGRVMRSLGNWVIIVRAIDSFKIIQLLIYSITIPFMFLFLNSCFPDHVEVALTSNQKHPPVWKSIAGRDALGAAVCLLAARRRTLRDLVSVVVVPGPGPFSRVRAGVTVANTLAFAFDIPLFALRNGNRARVRAALVPIYGKKSNITKPRRKSGLSP